LQHPRRASSREGNRQSLVPQDAPAVMKLDGVAVSCQIGPASSRISPLICGVAGADPVTLTALGATLNRWGGNPSDRYNWVLGNAWNAGRDWEFRNVNYSNAKGSAADNSVSSTLSA